MKMRKTRCVRQRPSVSPGVQAGNAYAVERSPNRFRRESATVERASFRWPQHHPVRLAWVSAANSTCCGTAGEIARTFAGLEARTLSAYFLSFLCILRPEKSQFVSFSVLFGIESEVAWRTSTSPFFFSPYVVVHHLAFHMRLGSPDHPFDSV